MSKNCVGPGNEADDMHPTSSWPMKCPILRIYVLGHSYLYVATAGNETLGVSQATGSSCGQVGNGCIYSSDVNC